MIINELEKIIAFFSMKILQCCFIMHCFLVRHKFHNEMFSFYYTIHFSYYIYNIPYHISLKDNKFENYFRNSFFNEIYDSPFKKLGSIPDNDMGIYFVIVRQSNEKNASRNRERFHFGVNVRLLICLT